ncbi:MAG: tRNA (N(6)-L-threonylcarbamoyladenosine(37)-C(2))-methylthiotransferase MtaB, partial [Tepidisphaeraceae bacterium]
MKTFSIQTLGCKVNQYESEQIAALLESEGLTRTESFDADLRIVNTCSVTTEAGAKSRQSVRRSTRDKVRRDSRVLVTGCWATSHPDQARNIAGVD